MIAIISQRSGEDPCISKGLEACLIRYVQTYGHITSLDRWAHEWNVSPWWVRQCAHNAARKGLLKLTRLHDVSGRPYRVTALEERTP
jgi:hypothetical protein